MRHEWIFAALAAAVSALIATIVATPHGFAADKPKSPPAPPPASTFAPADDLLNQFDFYVKHIEEALADKNEFDDAARVRLKKDGNTLVVLFLTLGLHDEQRNRLHERAPELIKLARSLTDASDFDTAKSSLNELKSAVSEGGPCKDNSGPIHWNEKVAPLSQLMKQVPTVNSALKRAVTPERFKKLEPQSAGQSATLAAIAQTIMADGSAVKTSADWDKWYAYCGEMRSAAGAVNAAIHADDLDATTKAMSRLAASCETCHAAFRKE